VDGLLEEVEGEGDKNYGLTEFSYFGSGSDVTDKSAARGDCATQRHRISAGRLSVHLDEMTWRFNNRKNPFLFRDTMLKLIYSDNLEYKELTSDQKAA
jgi:hypothetical protein